MIYMDGLSKKVFKMLNIVLIMWKYPIFIYINGKNGKPTINCFKNEIKNYRASLKVLSEANQSINMCICINICNNAQVSCFVNYNPVFFLKA